MATNLSQDHADTLPPAMAFHNLILLLLAILVGALAAVVVLPAWLPGLGASLVGAEPKAYWYLSRASAFVAFGLLWLATIVGLVITNKLARLWPGGPVAFDLHQYLSLLGLAFALFHAVILLGDRTVSYRVWQLLVPFTGAAYRPFWVGLGQIGLAVMALVALSFYGRRRIGHRLWRLIHFASFLVFLLALIHGLASGTDSATPWARVLYWTSGGSVLFLSISRLLIARLAGGPRPARADENASGGRV